MEQLVIYGLFVFGLIVVSIVKFADTRRRQANGEIDRLDYVDSLNTLQSEFHHETTSTFQNTNSTGNTNMEQDPHNDTNSARNSQPATVSLILDTLRELRCQPNVMDDNHISVGYQGENFLIICGESAFVQIWDLRWAGMDDDDPRLPLLRMSVNSVNFSFGPSIALSYSEEDNTHYLNSQMPVVMVPELPNKANYLASIFAMFFEKKDTLRENLNQALAEAQKEAEASEKEDAAGAESDAGFRVPSGIDPETGNFVYDDIDENSDEASQSE